MKVFGFSEKAEPYGVVYKRLLNRERYYNLLKEAGVEFGLGWEAYTLNELFISGKTYLGKRNAQMLLDKSAKPIFKPNFLWKAFSRWFAKDVVIPFVTGYYTLSPVSHNLITTKGHQVIAQQLGGTTTTPVTAIAIGTGTTAAAAGDTALQTEITTGGGARGAATITNVTVTTTGDTEQWVKTFSFTSSFAVTEEGLLDNNASGGNLAAHQVFSAINVANGDSIQFTHKATC